jgi:hypothetical protein
MRFPGPDGTVAHAEVQIGDSVVIIEDESPERGTTAPPPGGVAGPSFSLFIYVEDVDGVVARAVELGATLQRPPRTSSTATATVTSWTRSGMDGRSRRMWRTWRRRSSCDGWPSCRTRPSRGHRPAEARSVWHVKYVLLFVDTEQFANDLQAMGPAERERAYDRVEEWFATHAGKIRGGRKLQSPETATTVRLEGGEPVITDGPFVEGKEVVSGYAEIEVADLDEALRMIKTWPGCPVVEIRPLE